MIKWAKQQPFPEGIFIEISQKTGEAISSPDNTKDEDKSSVLDDSTLNTRESLVNLCRLSNEIL